MRNKRLVLIITIGILALAIIGAGIFYAARFTNFPSKESAKQAETLEDETANWKTKQFQIQAGQGFEIRVPPAWKDAFMLRENLFTPYPFGRRPGPVQFGWWTNSILAVNPADQDTLKIPWELLHIDILASEDAAQLGLDSKTIGPGGGTMKRLRAGGADFVVVFYKPVCQDCEPGSWYTERRAEADRVVETFRAY
ncbi:MAG: hypothetical protein A2128_01035 [Candidatus Liptonbacteria bacterium GWC1_60_9]|uniref:Uncharacterized protein n=2 Tax=Candidatus Liptoniibacteriota TaxID=1817909 RepID=A0A1G2C9Y9_9BACT|nr:MAG: hypothetical protein A2128_01035 [Candidatus Liptonbacteria bacterium GWC1_60_9]OGY98182.1 MAG: hypothetical protein A3E09_00050 [Candidatus Liptonbacteria bacterium RIFCSPHIGHO2_12_FULL_60_13]HLB32123.1 hypothetical protein [Patescibacteria group bacterium]